MQGARWLVKELLNKLLLQMVKQFWLDVSKELLHKHSCAWNSLHRVVSYLRLIANKCIGNLIIKESLQP